MSEEINDLQTRIQKLEKIEHEYNRLQSLIDYAADGLDLARYMAMSVIYVDPSSGRIVEANEATVDLLGYSLDQLVHMTIDDLELSADKIQNNEFDSTNANGYSAIYQHSAGYPLAVTAYKQTLYHKERQTLYYRLADTSLHKRLWYELQRREHEGFNFQQKLTALNQVTIELSKIDSFDALCYQVIYLGVEKLGIDRLGLWLVDREHEMMQGTYGVDEHGHIRAEHKQSWSYVGTLVAEFVSGNTDKPLVFDGAPLYNEKSEIVHYGWQITVPLRYGQHCFGTLSADNYRRNQPIQGYEPELLRLYGITVAHLMELSRSREQAIALRVAHQLTNMLSEFITNIGHDFRNPLSIISNKAYLIQRSPDVERRKSLVTGIQEQVKHISGMVNRALEFVALQRNPSLQLGPVDVISLVKSIVQQHKSVIDTKGIQVDVDIDTQLTVQADVAYLTRALSEIFENAVQYTGQNGQIRFEGVVYPHEVGIRIRDNGVGMDKDTLKRIFDPLYRGDQARTERHTGLGLAIAKSVIEAHSGRIIVDSTPGKGSCFEVILSL